MNDDLKLRRQATEARKRLGCDTEGPIDLFGAVRSNPDITLVFYPFKDDIGGLCIPKLDLIAINSKATAGRQHFSLGHELYHYFFGGDSSSIGFRDTSDGSGEEKEANAFASLLLMPDYSFAELVNRLTDFPNRAVRLQDVLAIEQRFRVSREAVLTRLCQGGYLSKAQAEPFKKDIVKNAKKYGYPTDLYFPMEKREGAYGKYLKLALELKELGLISEGKYEEYLLDAYREDIVFDENSPEEICD